MQIDMSSTKVESFRGEINKTIEEENESKLDVDILGRLRGGGDREKPKKDDLPESYGPMRNRL